MTADERLEIDGDENLDDTSQSDDLEKAAVVENFYDQKFIAEQRGEISLGASQNLLKQFKEATMNSSQKSGRIANSNSFQGGARGNRSQEKERNDFFKLC